MILRQHHVYRTKAFPVDDQAYCHIKITYPTTGDDYRTQSCSFIDAVPCNRFGEAAPGYEVGSPFNTSLILYPVTTQ